MNIKSVQEFIEKNPIEDIYKFNEVYDMVIEDLNEHNYFYYICSNPIISDYEYDLLFDYLKKLEHKFPEIIRKDSPTQRLASQIQSSLQKAKHKYLLLSLENTYSETDVINFLERLERNIGVKDFFVEPKYDGLSLELIYKNGYFYQAITRGNGEEGEDVTENVKTIQSVPLKIDYKYDLHIRGEVVIKKSIFNNLNKNQKKDNIQVYSNPRNLASGSLRQLDTKVTKKRKLDLIAYDILNYQETGFKKHTEILNFLENNNFFVFDIIKIDKNLLKKREGLNKNKVIAFVQSLEIKNKLDAQDIDFDGLVIKVNNLSLYEKIGYTSHHPKRAFAFKYPAKEFTSFLEDVEFSVGRTGVITPVAILKPVNISGVIVKRASLHNFDFIEEKDIKLGDSVFIKRSGEVIPYIVSVASSSEESKKIEKPIHCPVCGSETFKQEGEIPLKCINVSCPAQVKEKIAYFVSKNCLDIDGLGFKTIEIFYEIGLLKDYGDIFYIPYNKQKIINLPGFQGKKVENIIKFINEKKKISLVVFLSSLGIDFVGKKTSKIIVNALKKEDKIEYDEINFKRLSLFLESNNGKDFLMNIKGLGPQTAESINNFFSEDHNLKILSKILKQVKIYNELEIKSSKFDGKKYCITGSLQNVNRNDVIKFIEKNGGEVYEHLNKGIDFLLLGKKPGESKIKKAKEYGVKNRDLYKFLTENYFNFPKDERKQQTLF